MRQQEAEAHPAVGDLLILGAQLVFRLALVIFVEAVVLPGLLDLRPDLVELILGHTRRHLEVMRVRELVEQVALSALPGQPAIFLTELLADRGLQRGEILEAERLGERIVDRHLDALVDFLDRAVEDRVLAGQIVDIVVVGERHLDLERYARVDTHQLLLEARDELVGSELKPDARALTALEGDVVDLALEVDNNNVTIGRLAKRLDGLGLAILLYDTVDRIVDLAVGRNYFHPVELELGQVDRLDLGQDLDRHVVFKILALVEGNNLNLRLAGRTEPAFGEQLLRGFLNRALEHFAHHRAAVTLLENLERRLARTETREVDIPPDLCQARINALLNIIRRDRDLEITLQAFVLFFDNFHNQVRFPFSLVYQPGGSRPPTPGRWPLEIPHTCLVRVVRAKGLEPPRLFSHQDLNLARLPVPPRPRTRPI